MSFLSIIPVIGDIIDKVIPDPEEKMKLQLELSRLADAEAERASRERIAQTEVNKAEAKHSAIFVAGWRPAVGWSCVAGLLYTIILAPATGLPIAETAFLRDVLLGMLGINVAARSIEKLKGVAENTLTGSEKRQIDAPVPVPAPAPAPIKEKKKKGIDLWPF